MKKSCAGGKFIKLLVIIGALNWGLVGIGNFMNGNLNVVNLILGSWPTVESIVYILVGLAGVMLMVGCKCRTCKSCNVDAVDTAGKVSM